MVAIEKAGIPAVGIVARSFIRAWQACVEGWGQPSTAFVTIPHATTGQQAGFIRNMVDTQVDAVIRCLLAVSRLVEARPDLEELDLNPILAYPAGCLVVDAKVVLRTTGADA